MPNTPRFALRRLCAPLTLSLVVSSLGLGACEKDEPENEADFCAQFAERECAGPAASCVGDVAACQPMRQAACNQVIATLSAANRQFRPANGKACLDLVDATFKKALITGADLTTVRATCNRVIEGTTTANMTCAADQDCASPLICDKGFCGAVRQVTTGGPCANPGDTCVPDEICQAATAGGLQVCTPKGDRGAACSATRPCKTALRCQTTCMDKVANGQPCTGDADCQMGYCDLYPPAGVGRTCLPGLSFSPFSPACTAYFGSSPGGADAGAGN